MAKQFLQQLKKQWGLDSSTSPEDLLAYARKKLKDDPENPELLFNVAEVLRHINEIEGATEHYKAAIESSNQRTDARSVKLAQRVVTTRNWLRAKFILLTLLPLLAIAVLVNIGWKQLHTTEELPADADPEKFAFTQWLAKQQMVQIMTTLQQENPELTFDFSRSASSAQTPMEFMQSLMQPDAIERLRRDRERAANSENNQGEGRPAFQCSQEPAVSCSARDIPSAPGERREAVVALMEAYNTLLDSERDCSKLEKSIETIGQQLQWRKSERRIKASLEDFAVECFYRQRNLEKTIEHARKLQCAGDEGYINSVYWFLTAMNHHAGNLQQARTSYLCFQEATEYVGKQDFSPAYVASRHRESGALAWLYFDDLQKATEELKKGRSILRNIPKKTAPMLEVMSEIDLDLMETYVTANIDQDTFSELMEDVNSSGLLTDGYKQIKDTLASIYYMQNNKNDAALVALNNLASRFKLMPEYICGWDWSGFRRGLDESITDADIREKARNLVDAANCYEPQTMEQRINVVNSVYRWLKQQ